MIWDKLFGRSPEPRRREEPRFETAATVERPRPEWPADQFVVGNLAVGNLRENLLRASNRDGRVHAETLLAIAGMIVGVASLHAALAKVAGSDRPDPHALLLLRTKTGQRLLIGDAINFCLFERQDGFAALGKVLGAAVQAGVPPAELPNYGRLATMVVEQGGDERYGTFALPDGHPFEAKATELLPAWKLAAQVLSFAPPSTVPGPSLREEYWPYAAGWAAGQLLLQTTSVLAPRIGVALVAQAAFFCSRIDPDLVEPGQWSITVSAGHLAVKRLHP